MNEVSQYVLRFQKLLPIEYEVTLGRKGKLATVCLSFEKEECFHLMGLQYIRDMPNLKKNRADIFDELLSESPLAKSIEKSPFYNEIRERVAQVSLLEHIVDDNQTIFRYNANLNGFSKIRTDYLLDSFEADGRTFLFLSKRSSEKYFCKSLFRMGGVDFAKGQPRWALLEKRKINRATGESEEIYRSPNYKEVRGEIIASSLKVEAPPDTKRK